MSSVRNECYRVNRRGRRESTDRFESVDGDGGTAPPHDPYDRLDEVAILRVAFESLPAHQRELLWRTEVDEVSPTELAERNGSTPHAMAMMAMRARRALGSAYLDQHMVAERAHHDLDAACRDARPHLAAYVRGTLGIRRRRRVEAHLEDCAAVRRGSTRPRSSEPAPAGPARSCRSTRGAVGTASLGIKAQIVGWLSAQAVPVAASGMLAVSVLGGPMIDHPARSQAEAAEATAGSMTVSEMNLATFDLHDHPLPRLTGAPARASSEPGSRPCGVRFADGSPRGAAHDATRRRRGVDGHAGDDGPCGVRRRDPGGPRDAGIYTGNTGAEPCRRCRRRRRQRAGRRSGG